MHLIDHARAYIEEHYSRPIGERAMRALIAAVVPNPAGLSTPLRVGRATRPLLRFLPGRLQALAEMIPTSTPRQPDVAAGMYPSGGPRKLRVGLLAGCAQRVLAPQINSRLPRSSSA